MTLQPDYCQTFFFFKFILTVFNYVYVCVDMYTCVQVPTETMSDLLGTTVTDGCDTWYGCWELNLGPPGEQGVLLMPDLSLS